MTTTRRLLGLLLVAFCAPALAHPLAPAMLEAREVAPEAYEMLWRTSRLRVQLQDVSPRLPEACIDDGPEPRVEVEGNAVSMRWTVRCPGGLSGHTLRFEGLERSPINVIVRIQPLAGRATEALLDARRADYLVPQPQAARPAVERYFVLGVEHLLSGLDHLMFVGGLWLLVSGWRLLVLTLTAFTLGHSVTLALATLGMLRVSPPLAEFAIALSLLVLAWELARDPAVPARGWISRYPWWMASSFGLLHGLGFAGALAEVGLPAGEIVPALLGFNLGIEFAQIGVVAGFALLARALRGLDIGALWSRTAPVYLIGVLAAWWCIDRASFLWS